MEIALRSLIRRSIDALGVEGELIAICEACEAYRQGPGVVKIQTFRLMSLLIASKQVEQCTWREGWPHLSEVACSRSVKLSPWQLSSVHLMNPHF